MNLTYKVGLLLLLTTPGIAVAADGACGSGLTNGIVPERIRGCELTKACETHDKCYGKCDPGGELFDSAYCALSEYSPERTQGKQKCDDALAGDIIQNNPGNPACPYVGAIYRRAVMWVGQGPFNGRSLNPQAIEEIVGRSASPEQAANLWQALQRASDQGLIDVDRIRFDQSTIELQLRPGITVPGASNGKLMLPDRPSKERLDALTGAP